MSDFRDLPEFVAPGKHARMSVSGMMRLDKGDHVIIRLLQQRQLVK